MTYVHIMYDMCTFGQIFEKSSLEGPVATGIGMDNTDNIPGKYVMPGVPAVTSHDRSGHQLDSHRHPKLVKTNDFTDFH